ncbi:hypothetical protein DV738_g2894, partial [Chaetothyriales sp. CBS 135597]
MLLTPSLAFSPPPSTSLLPGLGPVENSSHFQSHLHSGHPHNHAHHHHQHARRAKHTPNPRSTLALLAADERAIAQRKLAIAMYGYSWLKPAGCSKTMLGRREEEIEREEVDRQLREVEMQERAALEAEEQERLALLQEEEGEGERDLDDEVPEADDEEDDEDDDEDDEDEGEMMMMMEGGEEDGMEADLDDEIPDADQGDQDSSDEIGEISGVSEGWVYDTNREQDSDEEEIARNQMAFVAAANDRDLDDDVPEADEGGWEHTDSELEDSEMDISILPPGQAQQLSSARRSSGLQQPQRRSSARVFSGNAAVASQRLMHLQTPQLSATASAADPRRPDSAASEVPQSGSTRRNWLDAARASRNLFGISRATPAQNSGGAGGGGSSSSFFTPSPAAAERPAAGAGAADDADQARAPRKQQPQRNEKPDPDFPAHPCTLRHAQHPPHRALQPHTRILKLVIDGSRQRRAVPDLVADRYRQLLQLPDLLRQQRQLNYVEHYELSDRVNWAPRASDSFQYVEGRQYEKLRHCRTGFNFWADIFAEEALDDWLGEKGNFARPDHTPEWGALQGGFRLLLCGRSLGNPPNMMCSQAQMLAICQALDLAPETVPSLGQILGSAGSVQIIIKAFQKGELGNWTLSLRHNFDTAWTDALAVWTGWTSGEQLLVDGKWPTRFHHICALLQAVPSLWSHPSCVALAFTQHYAARTMTRCNSINQELVVLDAELGINQAGRILPPSGLTDDWPCSLDFKKLTIGLHSANNQLVFVQQAAKWARRCLEFLLALEDELAARQRWTTKRTTTTTTTISASIKESLAYQISVITGVEDSFEALKARAQGATSVLFNASSQNDSLLNVKIAASTKEDSIVMKTFTFLTALFLPGTFTQSRQNSDDVSVSRYYWVYWVLTVPLTLLVMLGWYLWYRHANQKWIKQAGLPKNGLSSSS